MGNLQPFVISPCKLALFFKQMHFTSTSNELWSDLKYIEDNINFFLVSNFVDYCVPSSAPCSCSMIMFCPRS